MPFSTKLSWLCETEYLRLEALVEDAEWTVKLHDRVAALPELPLGLDPFLSFLDEKVSGFIAPPWRGISSKSNTIFTDAYIRRLQKLRVAQQDAFGEAEFLDSPCKVDAILENKKERYPDHHVEGESTNRWLEAQFSEDLNEVDLRLGLRQGMALLWCVEGEDP